jgi:hypothetical protein
MIATPQIGQMSGRNIIGEVTESVHKFLLDGYDIGERPPRFEEELSFVPKDKEQVIYLYMYRICQNPSLVNQKRFRQAPVFVKGTGKSGEVYYHRPPLLLDLFYLLAVHSKFRSDAERLLGWMLLRLNEATHLIYRPRKFLLPDGRGVDSIGRTYDPDCSLDDDDLQMEKVSLALVDDLTVGDAVNLYSLHEAPYRPFLTYRARVALDGPLVASSGGTTVRMPRLGQQSERGDPGPIASAGGRIKGQRSPRKKRTPPGPTGHNVSRDSDTEVETED